MNKKQPHCKKIKLISFLLVIDTNITEHIPSAIFTQDELDKISQNLQISEEKHTFKVREIYS